MSGTTVKPWTEIVRVRDDVRTGALSLQEFAADLFDVVNHTGKRPIYENPEKFFSLSSHEVRTSNAGIPEAMHLRADLLAHLRQHWDGKTRPCR
jgi:hypothetical protein